MTRRVEHLRRCAEFDHAAEIHHGATVGQVLHDGEVVLGDVNPNHLEPVAAYARKVVEHYGAPTRITTAPDWRGGALDGADFVITSFAQGGASYRGEPFRSDICIPLAHGIQHNVGDTVGHGGVLRTMRTAPELMGALWGRELR